ncbi:MAG: TRAP transporter large permease [Sphaerochaeta sp.]|nr:TRAP transporter large permease [Sphaerochaeta sp.]
MYYILTIGLVLLLSLGIPVGMSLVMTGLVGYIVNIGPVSAWVNISVIPQKMTYSLMNFLLLSIPLFILAAKVMNKSSITKKIFGFANVSVGFLPGGLAHANVFASLLFAGMSGAAVSDAAGLGRIEIESMIENGYDPDFSAAVTAASSTIGPIFPPSVPMVVYSTISGVSVGKLFLGGVVPGLLMTITMMIMIVFYSLKRDYPRMPFPTFKAFGSSLKQAILPLLTPVILLTGIWTGVFTPTESAVVAAAYALAISFFVYRDLNLKGLFQLFKETARDTASIGFVIAAAAFYGWVLARSGLTYQFADWIGNVTTNPIIFLLMVNVFLLLVGCFLEAIAAIMIFGPILYGPAMALGVDPVQFGVIMVLNLMIGLLTPPFGIVLFITQGLAGISFQRMVKAILPFFIPLITVLLMITFFPGIVTWLPNVLQ